MTIINYDPWFRSMLLTSQTFFSKFGKHILGDVNASDYGLKPKQYMY